MPALTIAITVGLVAGAGFLAWNHTRTRRVLQQSRPGHDGATGRHRNRHPAERTRHARERHHQQPGARPLDLATRTRYLEQWTHIQAQFAHSPEAAADRADRLVITVMSERGYPTGGYEAQLTDLLAEHTRALRQGRDGREISATEGAQTEDLRQAMVHYRNLIEDLLAAPVHRAGEPSGMDHTTVAGLPLPCRPSSPA